LLDCQSILDKRIGSTATYQLAVDICKKLAEDVPMKEDKTKTKVKSDRGEENDEESPTGKPASADSEARKKSSKGGEGEDKAPSEDDSRTDKFEIITIVLTEEDLESYSITKPRDPTKMSNTGINHEPVALHRDGWKLTDYKDFCIVDYPNNLGEERYLNASNPGFLSTFNSRVGSKMVAQENFAQQVRRLIQIRAKVQTEYGVRKGKLDQARLSRICFNAPGLNEKVFKRKIENKTLDAAVSVLVDMSGSMGGDKVYNAIGATVLLNEVCSTLGIPLEITGFSDEFNRTLGDYVPQMFIFKNFQNLRVTTDDLVSYFSKASHFMTGNPDGENILWSYDRLLKRKEKKRLFIVMSDGEPCASGSTLGVERFTLQVIQEIEKDKLVDIYGLGLCSTAVSTYYKHRSVVNEPSEIPNKLLELIEKRLLT
jgi:cobalamin biosynthesis protein CobT